MILCCMVTITKPFCSFHRIFNESAQRTKHLACCCRSRAEQSVVTLSRNKRRPLRKQDITGAKTDKGKFLDSQSSTCVCVCVCVCVCAWLSTTQSLSRFRLFATPWTAARQASLSITNSRSLLKLMSIESAMPSSHLILCHPLLLLPWIFLSIIKHKASQYDNF